MLYEEVEKLEVELQQLRQQVKANSVINDLLKQPKDLYVVFWDECEISVEWTVFANSPQEAISKVGKSFTPEEMKEIFVYKICTVENLIKVLSSEKAVETYFYDFDGDPYGYSIRRDRITGEYK